MAKNDNLTDLLRDVADAIREKKGTTELINPQDFSAEIASIQSGGGGGVVSLSPKAVNFRDYDGTILHAYSKEEFLALNELPPLPTREGLVCQGWNYNFDDAIAYVTEYGVLEVGATYITDDGKTRLYIRIATEGRMDVPLYFSQTIANGVTIDWGDGSELQTLSGTGKVNTTHHYDSVGDYCIVLDVAEGCILDLGHASSSYCVMGSTSNEYKVYCNMLQRAEIGNGIVGIGKYAFCRCQSLAFITIPQGITLIDDYIFYYCYSLVYVVVPKQLVTIGVYAFAFCYALETIALPCEMDFMGQYCFYTCESLKKIIFPNLEEIKNSLLRKCSCLLSAIMPTSIKKIGGYVFNTCYGLAYCDFSAFSEIPQMDTYVFANVASDCKIIVPDALYDTWIAATNWSTYASNIIKKSEWDSLNA